MKGDSRKIPQTSKVKRVVRSSEVESTDSQGKKTVTKETFFDDGSSVKEVRTFKDGRLISHTTTESQPPKKNDTPAKPSVASLDVPQLSEEASDSGEQSKKYEDTSDNQGQSKLKAAKPVAAKIPSSDKNDEPAKPSATSLDVHQKSEVTSGSEEQSKRQEDTYQERIQRKLKGAGPGAVHKRSSAPATKILPVEELLTEGNFDRSSDAISAKPAKYNAKPPRTDTANSLIVPNTDVEEGLASRSVASNSDNRSQSSSPPGFISAKQPNPEQELVHAYLVPDENQLEISPPITEEPKEDEPESKSVFLTEDGKVKKKCWVLLVSIVIIVVAAGAIIGATAFKSSSSPQDPPTPVPTEQTTPSPSPQPTFMPTFVTECSELCLNVVSTSDCPSETEAESLRRCDKVPIGELCNGDGECGTETILNNCNSFDVYKRIECRIDQPWPVGITGNGFEYYVELEEMDWLSHVRKATHNNAHLVSIHSHQERNFVVNQIRRNGLTKALIGGLRTGVQNDPSFNNTGPDYWKWTDGTIWDYEHWNSGQPDNSHLQLTETVVELDHGMNDIPPTIKVPAVYKRATLRSPTVYTYKLPANLGNLHSCVMNSEMELFCMGSTDDGRLGIGVLNDVSSNIPTIVTFSENKKVKSAANGYSHSCAILEDDSLECWGDNVIGQLGVGDAVDKFTPQVVNVGASRTVKQVSLGYYHSCALLDDTSLRCWGWDEYGQLGTGSYSFELSPQPVNISPGKTVKQVACGGAHTCVVLDDGDLSCWGANSYGQLGDGTNITRTTPVDVDLGGKKVKMVSLGFFSSCAVLVDDTLKCWGRNNHGQLGIGTETNAFVPTDVNLGIGKTVKQISSTVSGFHRCAILNDETLKCWGKADHGQLGTGFGDWDDKRSPTDVFLNGRLVKEVSVGSYHTCAVLTDEALICWGRNADGQLGYKELAFYNTANDVISLIF